MPACPHCSKPNVDGSQFCVSCGRAVPTATRTGPRVLADNDLAASSAGQSVQLAALSKQIKPAINTLLALGVLQAIIGAVFLATFNSSAKLGPEFGVLGGILVGLGALFLGLSFWARKSPLPATISGLTIYTTLTVLDFVTSAASSHPEYATRGIIIRVFIIAALARAVSAAVKHRALSRQMAQDSDRPMRMAA